MDSKNRGSKKMGSRNMDGRSEKNIPQGSSEKGDVPGIRGTNYGNWVPAAMMKTVWSIVGLLLLVEVLNLALLKNRMTGIVVGILLAVVLAFAIYMQICRRRFSFEHGGLMGEIHEFLVEHCCWDGNGIMLDIGCGAGALTIRCAKRFPKAKLVGMDFWGKEWSYAKEQCERNAQLEGVSDSVRFEKGDAAKLKYAEGSFDAAVSNFVFHEVRSQPDKRLVVKEALRVVKKGGVFSFQDMFEHKTLYGDMQKFVEELKKEGITEIHYIPDVDRMDFIPGYIRTPWMLKGMGLLYGKK